MYRCLLSTNLGKIFAVTHVVINFYLTHNYLAKEAAEKQNARRTNGGYHTVRTGT